MGHHSLHNITTPSTYRTVSTVITTTTTTTTGKRVLDGYATIGKRHSNVVKTRTLTTARAETTRWQDWHTQTPKALYVRLVPLYNEYGGSGSSPRRYTASIPW
jgi:hypothetical protein